MRIFSTTFGKETKFRVSLGMLMLLLLTTATVNGQTGYIYVHKKALNEVNKNFTFSVTGGATSIPTFTLNDEPTQISAFFDIGASENGRLWAATNGGALYYRNANSTTWTSTGVAGVARVDGGPGGTCYFINSAGTVFSYDGVSAQVQISGTGVFGNGGGFNDIGSGWTGTPTSTVGGVAPGSFALYAVEDDGEPCKVQPTMREVQPVQLAAQSGEWVAREYINLVSYLYHDAFMSDPRLREVLDLDIWKYIDKSAFYNVYYFKFKQYRGNVNAGNVYDAEIYEIPIVVKEGVDSSSFENLLNTTFAPLSVAVKPRIDQPNN